MTFYTITISDHYKEIRLRYLYICYTFLSTVITVYYYQLEFIYLLTKPFIYLNNNLIATDITEVFFNILKLCIILGFIFSLPFIFYHHWCFFHPSLYKTEAKKLNKYFIIFFILIIIEFFLIYNYLFPLICEYFASYEINIFSNLYKKKLLEISPKISSYLSYSIYIYLSVLLFLQIPYFFIFLFYMNIYSAIQLSSKRSLFFLIILCLSAFFSPPDVISQLFLTISLYILLEICIYIGYIIEVKNHIK